MNDATRNILMLFAISCMSICIFIQSTAVSIDEDTTLQKKYAAILSVEPSDITNIELYNFVDSWLNVPYQYAASSKTGTDCSGLTCNLYSSLYEKTLAKCSHDIFLSSKHVKKGKLKEGDLVFFKIGSSRVSHVGIYLQNDKFVHASKQKGVIISDLNEAYYKKYFFKGGRIK